ncbi:MAG: signal peptide peptidase SppA [Candidatus Woesearchaeota archaeon]
MPKKEEDNRLVRVFRTLGAIFGAFVSIIFFFIIVSFVIAVFFPTSTIMSGNIAVVPIKGILTTGENAKYFLEDSGTPSEKIVEWIKNADKDSKTKAILLEIDSPGGSPVATEEIARAVKDANKTVIAVIRETGASGAYWIASAANYIFASKMSITGSIGVSSSRLEFAGLLKDYNVTYRRLVSGKYKDAGTRWKEMTPEEEALFQRMLDEVHAEFIRAVAENRNLPIEKVKELAHGFVFTGAQAKENGLVDAIGNKDDAIKYIEQKLNITAKTYEFRPTKSLLEEIMGISSQNIGYGIGTALTRASISEEVKITT